MVIPQSVIPGYILKNMLVQVSILKELLNHSENSISRWGALTRRFPELDDIVDRAYKVESLTPPEMRKRLINLHQTYVAEWNMVEPQISMNFSNQATVQQVPQDLQMAIQEG